MLNHVTVVKIQMELVNAKTMVTGNTEIFSQPYDVNMISDLEYLFDKYMVGVKSGKPRARDAYNLKLMVDSIQVNHYAHLMLEAKNNNDNFFTKLIKKWKN